MPKASSLSLVDRPATASTSDILSHQESTERSRSRPRNGARINDGSTDHRTNSPQSPTSPRFARHDIAHPRSALSPDAPSGKMLRTGSPSTLLDPPDPPYRKSQNSSSTSLQHNTYADTASLASSSIVADEDGSTGWKTAVAKGSTKTEAQEIAAKKGSGNRRVFNLLARSQSIRTSENPTEAPRSRVRPFARHIATAQRDKSAKDSDAPQTAPLEPEPGFHEMVTSRRNHSADRAQKDEGDNPLQKQNSSTTFFSNFKSHSSRAAEELRGAGKGLLTKFHGRERAPPEKQSITIASGSGLSDSEIQNMVDDAEKYAEADKERKGAIENANRADSVVNDTEKALNEFADRLDKQEADKIRELIVSMRELVAKAQSGEGSVSAEDLKNKTDELQTSSLTLFDKMHKARSEQSSSEGQQEQPSEGQQGGEEKKP